MPQRERVVVEDYNVGDRLRAYVVAVENGIRGPGDHHLAQPSEFR